MSLPCENLPRTAISETPSPRCSLIGYSADVTTVVYSVNFSRIGTTSPSIRPLRWRKRGNRQSAAQSKFRRVALRASKLYQQQDYKRGTSQCQGRRPTLASVVVDHTRRWDAASKPLAATTVERKATLQRFNCYSRERDNKQKQSHYQLTNTKEETAGTTCITSQLTRSALPNRFTLLFKLIKLIFTMEVDTGAAFSVISEDTYNTLWSHTTLPVLKHNATCAETHDRTSIQNVYWRVNFSQRADSSASRIQWTIQNTQSPCC